MKLNSPLVKKASGVTVPSTSGVPQGVSTSAILGMAVLELLGVYKIEDSLYVGYADDGILGSNKISDLKGALEEKIYGSGISLKESKCKYLKRNGTWVAPMKFLGCELDENREFRAATRSGNTSEISYNGLTLKVARKKSTHLNLLIGHIFCNKASMPDLTIPGSRPGSAGWKSRLSPKADPYNWSSFSMQLLLR